MNFVQKPAYKGYKAYEYLEEGKDYPKIEWAQWDWAGRHVVELEPDQEAMVQEILKKHPYISLHDHPTFYPKDMSSIDHIYDSMRQGRAVCGYEALSYSNIDCIFDNMMDGVNIISSPGGWKWIDIIHDLGMRLCDLAHQDFLIQCKTVDDIFAAKKAGKIAWVPCIEGAAPIENEVDRIDILYGLGVRQLGVTYSESNALGNGMKEDHDGGLTMFGKQCVERMNKVGIFDNMMDGTNIISSPNGWKWIDIIHDLGMRLCDLAHQDFIVHCKTVDDIFAAKKEGKIAMVFVIEGAAPIENEVDRIDILYGLGVRQLGVTYSESNALGSGCKEDHDGGLTMFGKQCVERMNKVGIDHVGFGVDCLYGDHVGVHHAFAQALSIAATSKTGAEYEEVPYVKYLENPTESSWNIIRWLVKHNYSDEDIAKVIGGNAIRVLQEVWA